MLEKATLTATKKRRPGCTIHFKVFFLLLTLFLSTNPSTRVATSFQFSSSATNYSGRSGQRSSSANKYPTILNMVWPFNGGDDGANTPTESMSKAASEALGKPVEFVSTGGGGGLSGGGGATTSTVIDKLTDTKYFVKMARNKFDMLYAEYLGVNEMHQANTIKVPTPIACGQHKQTNQAFCIFEYLEFVGGSKGSQFQLGVELAKMHRNISDQGFGFHVNNTIGATHQPNIPWMDDWADFWIEHRLDHMLRLTRNARLNDKKVEQLRDKTRELLSGHNPQPSLVHGDLWGGNKGFCKDYDAGRIVPVIFDPASYYGDREVDIAMTYLFGGFNNDFYNGYNNEWKLPDGHEKRRTVYNLYHILNHQVLFGGSYMSQARDMIEEILRS